MLTQKTINYICYPFGNLVIEDICELQRGKKMRAFAFCRCVCGNTKWIDLSGVTTGNTTSCGCKKRQLTSQLFTTHGESKTNKNGKVKLGKEFTCWRSMKRRCYGENSKDYCNYGKRGIKMCPRWLESFSNFLSDMGKAPSKNHTIERIDNDGDYCPDNCKWATRKEQNRNKRTNIPITIDGKTMVFHDWLKLVGSNYHARSIKNHGHEQEIRLLLASKVITVNPENKSNPENL